MQSHNRTEGHDSARDRAPHLLAGCGIGGADWPRCRGTLLAMAEYLRHQALACNTRGCSVPEHPLVLLSTPTPHASLESHAGGRRQP